MEKGNVLLLDDRGAILILLVALAMAIAALLALSIDASQVAGSQQKQHNTAQLAALAALTGFQEASVTSGTTAGQYLERLTAAVDRAEDVIGMEQNNLRLGTSGRQTDPSADELMESSGAIGRNSGPAGTITPGRWFFEEPSGGCGGFSDTTSACPCPSGAWKEPCFHPNATGDTSLTAFEVTLKSKPANPIRYVFGRILGADSVAISARGRASVKPRMSITGIDLSLSITGNDHIDWDGINGAGSNLNQSSSYVFPLDDSNPASRCAGGSDYRNPCLLNAAPFTMSDGCVFKANNHFHPMWYKLPGDRYATATLHPRTRHFRNDFSCWIIDGKHYLIDTSVHTYDDDGDGSSDGTYYGPEPLVSILSSYGQALTEVEKRTVPGDRIAFFGFDQDADLNGPRFLGPTNPSEISDWQEMKDLTNVAGVNDLRGDVPGAVPNSILQKRLAGHRFFPRPPDSYTDLAGALMAAARTVDDSSLGNSGSIDVTLLTDGLANVFHGDASIQPLVVKNSGKFDLFPDQLSGCTANDRYLSFDDSCWYQHDNAVHNAINLVTWDQRFWLTDAWNWYRYHQNTLQQVGWTPLAKRGFKINLALFSRDVQPHVLLKRSASDPNKCLSDTEARKNWRNLFASYDDHDDGAYISTCYSILGAPDACPYITIADTLYSGLVVPTGGIFVPIRKPCDPAAINAKLPWGLSSASCASGALQQKLDSELCARFTDSYSDYGIDYDFTIGLQADLKPTIDALIAAGAVDNGNFAIPEDGTGIPVRMSGWSEPGVATTRTICDTKCRTPEQQLQEMYKTIFDSNPYVLVRDDT